MEEPVVFLTEIKRLYDERHRKFQIRPNGIADCDVGQRLQFIVSPENDLAFTYTFRKSIRQLLIPAFCGWHVFKQSHINLKFICGIYFTLIRFTRPSQLHQLPTLAALTGEKRKYNNLANAVSATKDIPDSRIAQLVPRQSVEVIYWREAVTDDPRDPELHLSVPFRSCFKSCLAGADSQPSSLFDVAQAEVRSKLLGPSLRK